MKPWTLEKRLLNTRSAFSLLYTSTRWYKEKRYVNSKAAEQAKAAAEHKYGKWFEYRIREDK